MHSPTSSRKGPAYVSKNTGRLIAVAFICLIIIVYAILIPSSYDQNWWKDVIHDGRSGIGMVTDENGNMYSVEKSHSPHKLGDHELGDEHDALHAHLHEEHGLDDHDHREGHYNKESLELVHQLIHKTAEEKGKPITHDDLSEKLARFHKGIDGHLDALELRRRIRENRNRAAQGQR